MIKTNEVVILGAKNVKQRTTYCRIGADPNTREFVDLFEGIENSAVGFCR